MKLLPQTNSRALRWTLVALVLACTVEVFFGVRFLMTGHLQGLIAAGFFLSLGIALWLRLRVARIAMLCVLWFFVAIVLLIGIGAPLSAEHQYWPNSSVAWLVVLAVSLCAVGALFAIHVLGKYKGEFR